MKWIVSLLLIGVVFTASAQKATLKGKVVHQESKLPYTDVTVLLKSMKVMVSTNTEGEYQFNDVPLGIYDLVATTPEGAEEQLRIQVNQENTELDPIELRTLPAIHTDQSAMNNEEAGTEDESANTSSGQNVSSVLNASRDAFLSAATFGWGQYFFRIRGYENDHNTLFMNGVPLNDLEEGGVFYNAWSGLNDVFRGRNVTLGLQPGDCFFGGNGLNTSLDASASNQRKGSRVTYTLTNRSYRNRIMLTHSSGLQANGWAYSFSFSRRWANQGPVKGTFYDAWGYYAAIEKRFKKQGISFMVVGAPIQRGKNGPATDEVFNLAGTHYYNPYWGYQNGKVRNSRILKTHNPLFILNHDIQLSSSTTLNTAVAFQGGSTAQTGIDWQNAADPRPDYYRYLPSYLSDPNDRQEVADYIRNHPDLLQIHWDSLYEANRNNINSGYNKASYIVNATVEDCRKWNAAINLRSEYNEHLSLQTGLQLQTQKNHNYLRIEDMLGGGYWENINQFAARTFGGIIQDADKLNVLDQDIKRYEGDTYGYNYDIHFSKAALFGQGVVTYNKIDFFLAAELGYSSFFRNGYYQSGLYTTNSFGESEHKRFFTPKAKGGLTLKLNGRNYIYANGSFGNRAPYVDNVIISPRTRNEMITDAQVEKFGTAEVGYLLRTPRLRARLTFFATDIKDACDIRRFYRDDDYSFVSMAMQGIDKRYTGMELGAEVKVSPSVTASLATSLSQAFYTSRPVITMYSDNEIGAINSTVSGMQELVYMQNYYFPSGPQSAAQVSVNYRSPRFWYGTVSCNFMGRNWMDFAPTARTQDGSDNLVYGSEAWHQAIDQKKLPAASTLDLNLGKSFKVDKYVKQATSQTLLLVNIGINNLLNNRNIRLYGFENLRVNNEHPEWFASKSAYALGTTYFINLSLRF